MADSTSARAAVPAPLSPPSHSQPPPPRKRKRSCASEPCDTRVAIMSKQAAAEPDAAPQCQDQHSSRIAHWVHQQTWPRDDMSRAKLPWTRPASRTSNSPSIDWPKRYQELTWLGIHAKELPSLSPDSRQLCKEMLKQRFDQMQYTSIPAEKFDNASFRAYLLNKARLQRDVSPWVIPSPELLHLWGVEGLQDLGEELNVEWYRCPAMGRICPTPDITVGLMPQAFSDDEWLRLDAYATADGPVYATPTVTFPFLVCGVVSVQDDQRECEIQNLHSAAIAVRAIFQLYERSWGWKSPQMCDDLDGQILVFSLWHDHHSVRLFGHFAVCGQASSVSELQYHRHCIRLFGLQMEGGRDRLRSYNFVRNLYDWFVPQHVARLRTAIAELPLPRPRCLEPGESSEGGAEGDGASDNASMSSAAMAAMQAEMAQLVEQAAQLKEEMLQQLEKEREGAKELERMREEGEQRLEEIRKEGAKQLAQQREEGEQRLERLLEEAEQLLL